MRVVEIGALCDCFPVSFWRKYQFEWLQINYSNEVKPEESINIEMTELADQPGVFSAVATNLTSHLTAFEAQFCFKQAG